MPAKTSEQRRAYDAARRRPERLKLRLIEDEAQRIRDAAAGAGMSLHTYMLAVVDGRARPVMDLESVKKSRKPGRDECRRCYTFDISPVGAGGKRLGILHPTAARGGDFGQNVSFVKSPHA